MTAMSDCEEDSGVHSQLQDERMDIMADNEGTGANMWKKDAVLRFVCLSAVGVKRYEIVD